MDKVNWLEFKNIDISYGKKIVLKKINLKLFLGEHTVIIGANGSGKSTLIKTICKINYPLFNKNSYIKIFGSQNTNIWDMRSKIGFVITDIDKRIKNNTLAKEVILSGYQGTFGLLNRKKINSEQINNMNEILKKLDLKINNEKYSDLSDGLKRRILIARSIINNPKVLILDEPSAMLDIKATYELHRILRILTQEGITILYVTNDINKIIKETRKVILLKNGEIFKEGRPYNILNSTNISDLYDYNIVIENSNGHWRTFPKS